jgi:hypothetical protein
MDKRTEPPPARKPRDVEAALDEALDESFPASDPPAILIA